MNISIGTVFPELYEQFLKTSLIGRAIERNELTCDLYAYSSLVPLKSRIDAPTFSHGPGMLIKPAVIDTLVEAAEKKRGPAYKIFFSPHGKPLTQHVLKDIYQKIVDTQHVMLISGRYEGMDARVEEHYADEILSVGDFVLMGGDVPAMMFLEGLLRLVPGIVGRQASIQEESFSGPFLDYPSYTEPVNWHGMTVPDVVRSGNRGKIDEWRTKQAVNRTLATHFDWLRNTSLSDDERAMVHTYLPNHYVALMHTDVVVGSDRVLGNTSVTTIDIHDIARSSKTYGIKEVFIVTPLLDQQKVVRMLLDFWSTGHGVEYNRHRHSALQHVLIQSGFDDCIEAIRKDTGLDPLIIATSARPVEGVPSIGYADQGIVWRQKRPVLLVFGTGQGLSDELINRCDYVLDPIYGLTNFNHLSVRTAIGVLLDRWLGMLAPPVNSDKN